MKVFHQKPWVVTTGKGLVFIILAHSATWAVTRFQTEYPALEIASVVEAEAVL